MSKTKWNLEEEKLVRKLWIEEKLSFLQISYRMPKYTKNAIAGKIHRLGLMKNIRRKPEEVKAVRELEKKLNGGKKYVQNVAAIGRKVKVVKKDITYEKKELSIGDLGARQCRYATSPNEAREHRFCGAASGEGMSYCDVHEALVRRKVLYPYERIPKKI